MKNIISITLLMLLIVGCEQNPYPEEGDFRATPRVDPVQPLPALSISVPDKIEYREGRNLEMKIRVEVEEPGRPVVNIDDLPEGATFDPETFMLKWKPGFFQGNDENDPGVKARFYPITIWLRSTIRPKELLRKTVNLVVFDVPRAIDIESTTRSPSVNENQELNQIITIKNEDYPKGPFKFFTKGLPANLRVEQVDENKFRLRFKPDYFHVNRARGDSSKEYEGKIIVSNPANHIEEVDYKLTVNDVRQESKIVAPGQLTQGLDVSFQVAGYDLNREIAPDIELLSNRPGFGTFRTEVVKNPDSFASVLNVYWNDIPPRYNGTLQRLRFKTCVIGSWGSRNNCREATTEVRIIVRDRSAPAISRNDWERGELVYLDFNESMTRNVTVVDNEDRNLKPKVEIFPEEMRKYVSWSNDRLRLRFNKAGVFQFNLRATSDYNMSSAESFIVEVFPETRNRTLLFADSTRDPEAVFYKKAFNDTMDIMNPAIQEVNLRNVSGRDTLVLTTSTLLDESTQAEVMKAIEKIKNVVIATPLIRKLPEKFLTMLEEKYDLLPIGRYSELPNMPPIGNMKIATIKKFQSPQNDVKLKLSASSESHDPMLFNGGLHDPDKICKGVMGLTESGNNPYVLGVSCKRTGGGRISILGTEWADLLTSEDDEKIPASWFETLLNGNF